MSKQRHGYILELTPEDKQVAKEKRGENPEEVKSCIESLRAALKEKKHFVSRDEDDYLLMILRQTKFSRDLAFETIEKDTHNRLRGPYNGIYPNAAELDPVTARCHKEGFCFTLPDLPASGVRTIVFRPGAIHSSTVRYIDLIRAMVVNLEIALLDPVTQVRGVQYIADDTGAGFDMLKQMTSYNLAASVTGMQGMIPGGYMGSHICNMPMILRAGCILAQKFMREENAAKHFHYHGSLHALHTLIEPEILPLELGGSAGTFVELGNRWHEHVLKHLAYLDRYANISFDESKVEGAHSH